MNNVFQQGFDSPRLHQTKTVQNVVSGRFFYVLSHIYHNLVLFLQIIISYLETHFHQKKLKLLTQLLTKTRPGINRGG